MTTAPWPGATPIDLTLSLPRDTRNPRFLARTSLSDLVYAYAHDDHLTRAPRYRTKPRRYRSRDRRRLRRKLIALLQVAADAYLESNSLGAAAQVLVSAVTLHEAQYIVYARSYPPPLVVTTRRTIQLTANAYGLRVGDSVAINSSGQATSIHNGVGQAFGRIVAIHDSNDGRDVTVDVMPPAETEWSRQTMTRLVIDDPPDRRRESPHVVRARFPQTFRAGHIPDAGWIGREIAVDWHSRLAFPAEMVAVDPGMRPVVGRCTGVSPAGTIERRIVVDVVDRPLHRYTTHQRVYSTYLGRDDRDLAQELIRDVTVYGTAYVDEWGQRVAPEMVRYANDLELDERGDIRMVDGIRRMHEAVANDPVMRMAYGYNPIEHTAETRADERRYFSRIEQHQAEMRERMQRELAPLVAQLAPMPFEQLTPVAETPLEMRFDINRVVVPNAYESTMRMVAEMADYPDTPSDDRVDALAYAMRQQMIEHTRSISAAVDLEGARPLPLNDHPNCRCVVTSDASASDERDDDAT